MGGYVGRAAATLVAAGWATGQMTRDGGVDSVKAGQGEQVMVLIADTQGRQHWKMKPCLIARAD